MVRCKSAKLVTSGIRMWSGIIFVTLRKGERAYFVADPLSSGIGDICESVGIQVTHQANLYIDNESTFAFGAVYDNGSSKQGTNGWYSGYVTKGEVISPDTFGSDPIPHFTIDNGGLFDIIQIRLTKRMRLLFGRQRRTGNTEYSLTVRGRMTF